MSNDITYIGETNWRDEKKKFGIKNQDRLRHIYCIGQTGVGKSTLLLNMAIQDIQHGNGLCVIDPHGDIAESLLKYIPNHREKDLIYFNPAEDKGRITFNPLSNVPQRYHHLVASGLVSTFKKIWADSWGPRMEHILRFTLLTLLECPGATLLDIQALLTDQAFREEVLGYTDNPHILAFWRNEYAGYSSRLRAEAISPILNKTGVFLSSAPLQNTVGSIESSFRMGEVMNGSKILIVNLSKGTIGEDASSILGSMLVTSIQLAALHRAKQPETSRKPFYLYLDEAHSFITLSFADILAEARKYKLGLFICHQYIEQLNEKIRPAIFGNVGTLIAFRVGAVDAEYLAKEFYPTFDEQDLIHLPKYSMYLKLMIDGAASVPFSAETLKN